MMDGTSPQEIFEFTSQMNKKNFILSLMFKMDSILIKLIRQLDDANLIILQLPQAVSEVMNSCKCRNGYELPVMQLYN